MCIRDRSIHFSDLCLCYSKCTRVLYTYSIFSLAKQIFWIELSELQQVQKKKILNENPVRIIVDKKSIVCAYSRGCVWPVRRHGCRSSFKPVCSQTEAAPSTLPSYRVTYNWLPHSVWSPRHVNHLCLFQTIGSVTDHSVSSLSSTTTKVNHFVARAFNFLFFIFNFWAILCFDKIEESVLCGLIEK